MKRVANTVTADPNAPGQTVEAQFGGLPTESGLSRVQQQSARLLKGCSGFIEVLSDDLYCKPSQILAGGTIGKHLRHLVDHFRALCTAVRDDSVVDYDHRERDVPMETSRAAAGEAVAGLIVQLEAMRCSGAREVMVRFMVTASGDLVDARSTILRELLFAAHHATHHCAMMRAIAAEHGACAEACQWPFGVSPSTETHRAARC